MTTWVTASLDLFFFSFSFIRWYAGEKNARVTRKDASDNSYRAISIHEVRYSPYSFATEDQSRCALFFVMRERERDSERYNE